MKGKSWFKQCTHENLTVVIMDVCALANTSLCCFQLHSDCDPSRRFVDEAHQSLRRQRNIKAEDPRRSRQTCVLEEVNVGKLR